MTKEKEFSRLGDIAVGSKTTKTKNQDAGDLYKGKNFSAVAVADGLGSSFDAHIASELVVKSFLEEIRVLDSLQAQINFEDVRNVWHRSAEKLKSYFEENKPNYVDKPHPLQTTMLTVVDSRDSYFVSYIGNGSILYLRGDFWCFWNQRWPWCMTDLMVGHSFLDGGKEALYGILAPTGLTADIRLLQLSKDNEYGEILILCSDGVTSADQLKIGYDPNNKLWIEVNPHVENLLNCSLKQYFKKIAEGTDTLQELDKTIERFLNDRTFDDDATLGIIMSHSAIANYLTKNPG